MCRCSSGDDWWYSGQRCEKRGSTRDTIIIAVSSTAAVFALMLIVTLVSVYCTRNKYRAKGSSPGADLTLENVSGLWYLVIQNLLNKSRAIKTLKNMFKKHVLFLPCAGDKCFETERPYYLPVSQWLLNCDPWRLLRGVSCSPRIVPKVVCGRAYFLA